MSYGQRVNSDNQNKNIHQMSTAPKTTARSSKTHAASGTSTNPAPQGQQPGNAPQGDSAANPNGNNNPAGAATGSTVGETAAPSGMVTPMSNELPGVVTPLNLPIFNGMVNLDASLPDEEQEYKEIEARRTAWAEKVAARRQQSINQATAWFLNLPLLANCRKPDGSADHDMFITLFGQARAGTLGQAANAEEELVREGHRIPQGIKDKIDADLRAKIPNIVIEDRYKVSLPFINQRKDALGLVVKRGQK